jgi:O-antigen/teichoic acid export membrane protein
MDNDFEDYLSEIFEKSFISMIFFSTKRLLMVFLSYIIISLSGASVYGIISVFIRFQELFRRLSYSIKSTLSWSLPRYDKENHNGILLSLVFYFSFIWISVFFLLFYFDTNIIENTLINDKSLIILFCLGLIPYMIILMSEYIFLALRNVRVGMFFSKFVIPVSIILGSLISFFIFRDVSSFGIWSKSILFYILFAIIGIYLLIYMNKYLFSFDKFNIKIIKKVIGYCIKTTGISLLSIGQIHSTYLLMALYLSPTNAGLFSLSIVLGKISRWFLSSINTIFPPIISEIYEDDKFKILNQLYKSTSKVAIIGCCIVSIPLITYHSEILVFFSEEYSKNAFSMIFVVLAQIVATFVGSVGLMLLMTSNEKESLYLQFFQTLITLPVMIYLTIQYGILGLSISYFFSLSLNNLSQLGLLYYLEKLNPLTKYHFLTILTSILIILVSYYIKTKINLLLSILLFLLMIIIFCIIIYKYFFSKEEKQSFKKAKSKI